MMRFWVIATLTAVTLAVTACGGAPAEDRSQAEAAEGLRTELDQTQTPARFLSDTPRSC
jgi:hypothetical protein